MKLQKPQERDYKRHFQFAKIFIDLASSFWNALDDAK